jgi:hypothetical protein
MTVTAAALSGILNKAGFRRANTRTRSWSSGFEVADFGRYVRVTYASVNSDEQLKTLKAMADLINGRPNKKYWAKVAPITEGGSTPVVKVYAYDETDPEQNEARKAEAQEELAADHPAAPAIADVKKALRTYSQYDADFYGFGYQVERLEEDTRLVRIRLVEAPGTTYEVDRDAQIAQTLANYARVVRKAGFEFQVCDEEMSVIVGTAGEWDNALTEETVSTVMRSAHTPWTKDSGGFTVCVYGKDGGAVRVQHYPFRTDDEKTAYATVKRYGQTLERAGYETVLDPSDDWAYLVTVAAPPQPQEPAQAPESAQQVREAILALRELVEADEPMYSTRSGGPDSVYIFAVNLNVLVSYSDGEYKTRGRNGRHELRRFPAVNSELLDFIRAELGL